MIHIRYQRIWRATRLLLLCFFLLTPLLLTGPLWIWKFSDLNLDTHWSRSSSGVVAIPNAEAREDEAVIQIYGARAYNWRGAFAVHTWIAIKQVGDAEFRRYDVIGWRHFRGMPVVSESIGLPNRAWFGNPPKLYGQVRGQGTEKLIKKVENAIASYPASEFYRVWPGPNSNTFTADVLRQVPEIQVTLPSTAVGKDFPLGFWIQSTTGGSGLQLTLWGIFGVSIGFEEGLRFQWFALEFGLNPWKGELYWPGIGTLHLWS